MEHQRAKGMNSRTEGQEDRIGQVTCESDQVRLHVFYGDRVR